MLLNYVLIASLYIYSCDSLCISKPVFSWTSYICRISCWLDFLVLTGCQIKLRNHSFGSPVYLIKNLIGLPASVTRCTSASRQTTYNTVRRLCRNTNSTPDITSTGTRLVTGRRSISHGRSDREAIHIRRERPEMNRDGALNYHTFTTAYWVQHHLAVETPTGSLMKFTKQSGRTSHNKEFAGLSATFTCIGCVVLYCIVLCCAVLCWSVLCCTVLCCVALCCVVLCCVLLCCAVLCCAVLCCAVLCCAVLCCVVLCCVVLCCAVLCCTVLRVTVSKFRYFSWLSHPPFPNLKYRNFSHAGFSAKDFINERNVRGY